MNERPFCVSCGYDLTGFDLPRACSECGQLADPPRDASEARAWAQSVRSWFWPWCRLPPRGLLYALHDSASARTARRRALLAWSGTLLTAVIVLFGTSMKIESGVKRWY